MRWLLYLYPKKWRERYGEEFLYILEKRRLSFVEIVDVFINAMDARMLILAEGLVEMEKKLRDLMLASVWRRTIIFGLVILIGLAGGYWVGNHTPSLLYLSPRILLLVGVGLGLFIGYLLGIARGILRVINVTQKEDVILPTGKLKFDKTEK